MKIVADRDIFAVEAVFGSLGELVTLPGREITRRELIDADALLVRSVLPVHGPLLQGTGVGFVGSATSGLDHIDSAWLDANGISLAHCRGANARAVVEYCLGAIARLRLAGCIDGSNPRIGVIGAGAIGGELARTMLGLGHEVVVCDPPLAEAGRKHPDFAWQSLAAALDCDIVSLHVPLTASGAHATRGMLGAAALSTLRPGAVLINASRGGVVDEAALLGRLQSGRLLHCVIDVWRDEPRVNAELARMADIATPHIAGYSEQAKWGASLMLARQLALYFGIDEPAPTATPGPAPLAVPLQDANKALAHWRVVDQCLGLAETSAQCKHWAAQMSQRQSLDSLAKSFDRLRRPRLGRREFAAIRLSGGESLPGEQQQWMRQAGFRL